MKKLFIQTDADFCPLIQYVSSFINEFDPDYNLIQLPPIQRNAVWSAAQIERLWDSLLRGFPIGSFLLAPRTKGVKSRDLLNGLQRESEKEGYFLLDGQQRTRALLLGFKSSTNSRLWIDLDPKLSFDNSSFNDRKFLFRYITSHQPWGMDDRIPSDKLSENLKYNARKELYNESVRYDYQVQIFTEENKDGNFKVSWPLKSSLPIPLDLLINLCGGISGKFNEPTWGEVCKLIPGRYHLNNKIPDAPTEHFSSILNGIRKLIDLSARDIKTRTVVLLYQHETFTEHAVDEIDSMEVLFTRVNAGGTVLNGEEMAYSLLKSSWDGAYEMVSEIVRNEEVGYLLPPTGIVTSATRLARFIMNKSDDPNPGISSFRKWIGEKEQDGSFLSTMQTLLQHGPTGKSAFQRTLELFCKVVLFREHNKSDIGLPKKLLLIIKPLVYHPVFIWIYKNINNEEVIEQNRRTIIRYMLLSFITIENKDVEKASRIAISLLRETGIVDFPEIQIRESLIEKDLAVPTPTPEQFAKPFLSEPDGFFRHWNDLFRVEGDEFNSFRQNFWHNKELTLWFQRDKMPVWFKDYDPMSNDAYDTPFDYDHILPKSHLINSGQSNSTSTSDVDLNNKFTWNRGLYINSIGNYRMWPFWANRADRDTCQTKKLKLSVVDCSQDSIAKELHLLSTNDFLDASSIELMHKELWLYAGGSPGEWPEKRRKAFQSAVEGRTISLYKTLYDEIISD